ncbi:MAG: LPS biosynthesis protein [Nitrospirales bacterium]|nr:MAG: LPS biosynthesis protein [Nitrospirales bacterium]
MTTSDIAQEQTLEEVSFVELFLILWRGKVAIIATTSVFAVASVIYALSLTNIYRAEAILTSAEDEQSNSLIPSQLSFAADLTGISSIYGDGAGAQLDTAIAILKSREFFYAFIEKYDLTTMLLASKWDDDAQANIIDEDKYDVEAGAWRSGEEPIFSDPWSAYKLWQQIFRVNLNDRTGQVTLSIDWSDPVQAAHWVNLMVGEVNSVVKEKDLAEANMAIEYLTNQIEKTQLLEMQSVFYQLIENQLRIVMLADVRDQYVLQVVDKAVVPEERISPRRAVICIIGTFIGGVLSVLFVFIRNLQTPKLKPATGR